MGARAIVGAILDSPGGVISPVVISEAPSAILPPGTGSVVGPSAPGPVTIPPGFYECIINGEVRLCQDKPPGGWTPDTQVFEPFDPDVVIGEVHAPDTTEQTEDDEMAHDWGHLLREGIGAVATEWWSPSPAATPGILPGAGAPGAGFVNGLVPPSGGGGVPIGDDSACGPCGPRYLTYDCKTGKFTKKRRRGRPRLATNRDLADLAAIVAITGKGSAMNQAVASMVRR